MELACRADDDPVRVALIADELDPVHSVARTLGHLRECGLPGYEIEHVRADALARRRHDVVHVYALGPPRTAALRIARAMGLPVAGSYHAERCPQAGLGWGDTTPDPHESATAAAFYRQCEVVLSPGRCADAALAKLGIAPARIVRWEAGVDVEMFNPGRYAPEALGRTDPAHATGAFNVLYAGPLTPQHGIDLLAESFLIARDRDPRLHLLLVGQSPQQSTLRPRLGSAATFLGCLEPDALASVYASADLFVLPNVADPLGQAVLEAQASGLPVLAIDAGAAAELIESGRSGCLAPADPGALASAIRGLARRRAVLDRLATGGLLAARRRSPERSLGQLARGYAWTLGRLADDDAAPVSEVAGVPRAA